MSQLRSLLEQSDVKGLRRFNWVEGEGRDVEIGSLEVCGDLEVAEIAKAPRNAFGQLGQAVDGFDRGVGELGFQTSEDAGQVAPPGSRCTSAGAIFVRQHQTHRSISGR